MAFSPADLAQLTDAVIIALQPQLDEVKEKLNDVNNVLSIMRVQQNNSRLSALDRPMQLPRPAGLLVVPEQPSSLSQIMVSCRNHSQATCDLAGIRMSLAPCTGCGLRAHTWDEYRVGMEPWKIPKLHQGLHA